MEARTGSPQQPEEGNQAHHAEEGLHSSAPDPNATPLNQGNHVQAEDQEDLGRQSENVSTTPEPEMTVLNQSGIDVTKPNFEEDAGKAEDMNGANSQIGLNVDTSKPEAYDTSEYGGVFTPPAFGSPEHSSGKMENPSQKLNEPSESGDTSESPPTLTAQDSESSAVSASAEPGEDYTYQVLGRSPTGRYVKFADRLGVGQYKTVWRAFDTMEGIEVAWCSVNLLNIPKAERPRIRNEVVLLQGLKHDNIVNFFGSWLGSENKEVIFITEILSSGSLKDFIRKMPSLRWRTIKRWFKSILEGLAYLHMQDPVIIHRDLKCDNIFVNGNNHTIRIGDFGLSCRQKDSDTIMSVLGTPEFMAPELYDESYDEKVDIYAFGMCCLEMVTKDRPYSECSNPAQIYKKVTSKVLPAVLSKLNHTGASEFIKLCLMADPKQRPTAQELLEHDFLQISEEDDKELELVSDGDSTKEETDLSASGSSSSASNPQERPPLKPSHGGTKKPAGLAKQNSLCPIEEEKDAEDNKTMSRVSSQASVVSEQSTTGHNALSRVSSQASVVSEQSTTGHNALISETEITPEGGRHNAIQTRVPPVIEEDSSPEDFDGSPGVGFDQKKTLPAPVNTAPEQSAPKQPQQKIVSPQNANAPANTTPDPTPNPTQTPAVEVIPNPLNVEDETARLKVEFEIEGKTKVIEFEYHLESDEPEQVAQELAQAASIKDEQIPDLIASVQSGVIQAEKTLRVKKKSHLDLMTAMKAEDSQHKGDERLGLQDGSNFSELLPLAPAERRARGTSDTTMPSMNPLTPSSVPRNRTSSNVCSTIRRDRTPSEGSTMSAQGAETPNFTPLDMMPPPPPHPLSRQVSSNILLVGSDEDEDSDSDASDGEAFDESEDFIRGREKYEKAKLRAEKVYKTRLKNLEQSKEEREISFKAYQKKYLQEMEGFKKKKITLGSELHDRIKEIEAEWIKEQASIKVEQKDQRKALKENLKQKSNDEERKRNFDNLYKGLGQSGNYPSSGDQPPVFEESQSGLYSHTPDQQHLASDLPNQQGQQTMGSDQQLHRL